MVNITFIKYISKRNETETVQPWFYLKFLSGENAYAVSASESGATASREVCSLHELYWCIRVQLQLEAYKLSFLSNHILASQLSNIYTFCTAIYF